MKDPKGHGEDSNGASPRNNGDLYNGRALPEAMLCSDRPIQGSSYTSASASTVAFSSTVGPLEEGDDGDEVPSYLTPIRVGCGWGHLSLDLGDGDGYCDGLGNGVCV